MKKRLLITSIVMMLVCAVALSTATYAWFTSNGTVKATSMTLRAATNNADALGIGWNGWGAGTAIDVAITETLNPMAPKMMAYVDTDDQDEDPDEWQVVALENGLAYEYDDSSQDVEDIGVDHLQFFTSTVKQEGGSVVFNNNGTLVSPITYSTEQGSDHIATTNPQPAANSFYIRNLSPANKIASVTVSAVFNTEQWFNEVDSAFDSSKTYYTRTGEAEPYVYTKATGITEFAANTTYYTLKDIYVKAAAPFVSSKTYYTASTSNNVTTYSVVANASAEGIDNYYEKVDDVSANDLIRVALFKKEYRQTTNTTADEGKTYYRYNPTTNVIEEITEAIDGNPALLGYFEVKGEGNDNEHTLMGVLGLTATTFKKETKTRVDMNTVYYTIREATAQEKTDENLKNLYEKQTSSDIYYKSADGKVESKTYYVVTQVSDPVTANIANYYVAENTVVNGEIEKNNSVIGLYYYTGVTKSITFAYDLLPNEQIDIVAVAWLDGAVLDDSRQGDLGLVSLKFDANNND